MGGGVYLRRRRIALLGREQDVERERDEPRD
jgi:hypothetical protein